MSLSNFYFTSVVGAFMCLNSNLHVTSGGKVDAVKKGLFVVEDRQQALDEDGVSDSDCGCIHSSQSSARCLLTLDTCSRPI